MGVMMYIYNNVTSNKLGSFGSWFLSIVY